MKFLAVEGFKEKRRISSLYISRDADKISFC